MVDARGFDDLRHVGSLLGFGAVEESSVVSPRRESPSNGDALQYFFGEMRFERAERFGIRTSPDPRDVEENLRQIKEARRMADWVIASLHCHKLTGGPQAEDEQLADFAVEFAHRCIDSGADIFVGHGPQKPLGIELYRDRPIFYSLGSTVFQLETPRFLPEEAYARYGLSSQAGPADFADARYRNDTVGHPSNARLWKQVCAKCRFAGRKLARIDLYPLDLGFSKPRWQRGRPLLADEQLGREIIDQVGDLSKKFGTRVCWEEGHGVILTR
jgi:poly-gamma-glutamate synthesis protein (capsule biosynthesis protein)